MSTPEPSETFRFGDFELDVAGCELRRRSRRVKLGRQAMDVLILLVQRRGQLVRRSDIVDRLWGQDVFVDVETGVNTAISKIRQALRDSADAPSYVETVPGRGYRFLAQVEVLPVDSPAGLPAAARKFTLVPGEDEVSNFPAAVPLDRDSSPPAVSTSTAAQIDNVPRSPFGIASRTIALTGLVIIAATIGFVTWTRVGGVSVGRVTLAVLPFENVGSDPEREYLATGLTQETNASLAQIDPERLSVKGRTWRYKGTTKTAVEIGQELSVDYLVESTLRSEGDRLRVTVTLIRVKDQEHVWSQSYERESTSLLGLEQELSTAIAEQVRGRLSPDHSKPALRQTQNADAYDAYLRGRYLESRRTPATNLRALQQYDRAIALDPNYALAWSSLAFTYAGSVINGDARPLDMWPRAREAAARAVRANPNLAEAQFVVGYVNWLMDWDWKAAETAFRLAIRLDGSNATAYRTLGHALSQSGRHVEAAAAMRRTRELEPLESISYALSAQVAFQAREYRAAVDYARHAVLIDSELWIGYAELGLAYEQVGENDLALAALTDAMRFSGGNSKAVAQRGYILAKVGRTNEAREVLSKLERDARQRYVPPYAMALVNAGLGQREAVFEWLNRAYAARDVHLIYLPVDAKWDAYRADPRFIALLAQCGFTSGTERGK
jgi:DNA-binding winged helix-turn-helix (wHTH) protein/TolB-like protein/Flp pilus assembly protein TadD